MILKPGMTTQLLHFAVESENEGWAGKTQPSRESSHAEAVTVPSDSRLLQ